MELFSNDEQSSTFKNFTDTLKSSIVLLLSSQRNSQNNQPSSKLLTEMFIG